MNANWRGRGSLGLANSKARLYHGGRPRLSGELLPPASTGAAQRPDAPLGADAGRVYVSEFPFLALAAYALDGPWMEGEDPQAGGLYEVEPGELSIDPEHLDSPPGSSYLTPRARILRRFEFPQRELRAAIPVAIELADHFRRDTLLARRVANIERPKGMGPILFEGMVQWGVQAGRWEPLTPKLRAVPYEAFALRAARI